MAGINSKALMFGEPGNKEKFNSIEQNTDFDLNMYDAFYRNLDPQIGRFWQLDPKPSDSISLYAFAFNNPIKFFDFLGDTVGIDLLKNEKSGLANPNKAGTNGKNDGNFIVYAHANSRGIQIRDADGTTKLITDPKELNDYLKANSPEYATAMSNQDEITVTFLACNSGSNEYCERNTLVTQEESIAQKFSKEISKDNPNNIVVAPDGYCAYSTIDGKATVIGIRQTSVDNNQNTGQGGFVKFKNGEKISKIKYAANGTIKPDKGKKIKF